MSSTRLLSLPSAGTLLHIIGQCVAVCATWDIIFNFLMQNHRLKFCFQNISLALILVLEFVDHKDFFLGKFLSAFFLHREQWILTLLTEKKLSTGCVLQCVA